MNRINVPTKRKILIGFFFAIFLVGTILIFTVPTSVKITYGVTTTTEDGETISFNIFEPQEELYKSYNVDTKKIAVIIGHGIMVNKEMLKGYAIELAAAGFVAVPLDFRGHGQSSGHLNSEGLINDVKAIKMYLLKERSDIDPNNFGYIGYSMGGGPGWAMVKEDKSFKCFIGIGTGMPTNDADVVRASSGRRLNVLMIQARYDEAVSLERLKEGMAKRLDVKTWDVNVNKLYGSFKDGDASMIFLDDNSNHLLVAWDQDFIREARNWVISSFPSIRTVDRDFYANIRALILVIQLFGGIGFFFLIIEPLSNAIVKSKEEDKYKIEVQEVSVKNLAARTIIFSLVFGIIGTILFIPVFGLLPLFIAGFVLALLYGQVCGILILLWRTGKKINLSLLEILKGPFKGRKTLLREVALGALLAVVLYAIIILSIGLNYLGLIPSLYKMPYVPIYYAIVLVMYLIFGLIFNVILQNKFKDGLKELYTSALLTFGILLVYMAMYLFVYGMVIGSLFYFGTMIPVALGIYSLAAFTSSALYQKTKNVVAGAIVIALYFTVLICTLSPL